MFSMSKKAITRLFLAALVVAVAGAIVVAVAVVSAVAGGLVTLGGPTVVTVNGAVAWGLLGPLVAGSLAIAVAAFAAIVSWVGALLNTARLDDKTWFVALVALGLFSFGWLAMIAYIVAGPDGTAAGVRATTTGSHAAI